jgi:hypothetical protein
MKTIVWDPIRISGGNDGIIAKAAKKMLQSETIITDWAPALLLMELDNVLWKDIDNIVIKKLWEYLCTYCYLPRLANDTVLEKAIQTGLNSTEYFAFASGFDGSRYIDLKFNQYVGIIERSGYLVKVAAARKQIADDEAKRQRKTEARAAGSGASVPASIRNGDPSTTTIYPSRGDAETQPGEIPEDTPAPKNRCFFMSADLDTTRIGRDMQKYVEEIIQHLTTAPGTKVKVSLEIEAEATDGFTQQTVRTVSENCRTLRVRDSGFEE